MYINMSDNSSSFVNYPLLPTILSSSNTTFPFLLDQCFKFKPITYIFTALYLIYILLPLPLFILVLHLGYQKSRKPRSSSTATSHSDHLTYHSIFLQLNECLGLAFLFIGGYTNLLEMLLVGITLLHVISVGQALFHLLTCVERYLAVVHPITYLGLRQGGGVRLRNISIGCVWLFCVGYICAFSRGINEFHQIMYYCLMGFFLIVLCFCSISVLYVLKLPGPREGGGTRERVDQSKQRAFYTIMAIMGVLMLRFGGGLICIAVQSSRVLSTSTVCVVSMSSFWLGLPSSLVLPLLCLHRAGKLQCCKQNTDSG